MKLNRIWVLTGVVCSFLLWQAARAADPFAEGVRPTEPLPPEQQQKKFHLPPGFEIQLVAAEPDLRKPMNMAFDARGRLWLTESREYPFAATNTATARDTIRIFSEFDANGRARKVQIFAEGLNIPIGIYPFNSPASNGEKKNTWKCIVWSIPNIWLLEDTDGDGKADKKEILYGPFDHTRDTHGNQASFRRGFDGWLYATHGFNNDSHVKGRDGHQVDLNSGNTYRMRLDGSRLEHHTHGQVNPFGLAWDAVGNLYSSDCHSAPTYQLLAGGYYPSFGKPDDGLGYAPTLMEHAHGSTAIDGMVYYNDNLWPAEFQDNTFLGNVMTSRINRDRMTFTGSSPKANELDDFVKCDDPWFRPVDNQLGPDGAFYIADFYNRIIGHYEVPLNHPGRDRERGRIWRVIYRGADGQAKLHHRKIDLTQADAGQLINELADPNLTWRMLAMNQLCDRVGKSAVSGVMTALSGKQINGFQTLHCLWVLQRFGALDETALVTAFKNADRTVRIHVMRILIDTPHTHVLPHLAIWGLADPDALVQRCAAEALGGHPQFENVEPLLKLRTRTPAGDTHLLYVVRKAIRDQLKSDSILARVTAKTWPEYQARPLADVVVAVNTGPAGSYLLNHLQRFTESQPVTAAYLRHAARYAPESELDTLANFTQTRFAKDLDFQLDLFKSVQEGTAQRGAALSAGARVWGTELAGKLFSTVDVVALWSNSPLPGAIESRSPWAFEPRTCADGLKTQLMSSLPFGEHLTGALRSSPFSLPSKLSFYLCGHDGFPDQPAKKMNKVRLRDAASGQVLREVFPPRNDTAQLIAWDLAEFAGRNGYVEVVDGDTGSAYAWLAVGRFDPSLPQLALNDPNQTTRRLQTAADLAGTLKLASLEPQLYALLNRTATEAPVQAAAARALVSLHPDELLAAMVPLLGDAVAPAELRAKIVRAVTARPAGDSRVTLTEVLGAAPYRAQVKLAQALAGSPVGAEILLQTIALGKAAPQLLVERAVKDRLAAIQLPNLTERLAKLTKSVAPVDQARQRLLDQRRAAFDPAKASAAKGAEVFTKTCALCHQIDGKGVVIGPQLDGVGGRGLERLIEDILDPNRNVDSAFRSSTFVLTDGEVMSGLFRREEGESLIVAESSGKEISFPKKQVKERRESESSLMPDNFADVLSAEDFNHLLAYLLSKVGK